MSLRRQVWRRAQSTVSVRPGPWPLQRIGRPVVKSLRGMAADEHRHPREPVGPAWEGSFRAPAAVTQKETRRSHCRGKSSSCGGFSRPALCHPQSREGAGGRRPAQGV